MNQKQLIKVYKQISEDYIPDYSRPSNFIKSQMEHYKTVQDGLANPTNFFDSTVAIFEEVEKPKRKPDFESDSGSRYWYSKKGLLRGSNHWGCRIVNCDWALKLKNGKAVYGSSCWASKTFSKELYGFVKWEDFVLKPNLYEIEGKEVLTTFANKIGRNQVKIGKATYQSEYVLTWEKI
ncbi:MAG: hypothetical protein J6D29_07105 [Solobacterium sp.]|nr:hypothetical protein [Solobacterium sp.]